MKKKKLGGKMEKIKQNKKKRKEKIIFDKGFIVREK